MLKPVRFVFCVSIMVIPSLICFPSFLTISYCFPWCFRLFFLVFLRFPRVFLQFNLNVSPVSYFRFCAPLLQKTVTFLQRVYDVGFPTKYQRCNNNFAFLKSFSCIRTEKRYFWSCLVSLIRNSCFLVANSIRLWFNHFRSRGNQKKRVY